MNPTADPAFDRWLDALQRRHLESLSFAEVRRALQALSTWYVERRGSLTPGRALDGRGKRAAYALFYAPLHYLVVREVVRSLGAGDPPPRRILDLGCGTGAAGAAWALACPGRPALSGIDRSDWAAGEARWAWGLLGLGRAARRGDLGRARLPGSGTALLAAYVVNELAAAAREQLLPALLAAASRGARVLVVEPVSRRVAPWWKEWADAFGEASGRDDTWRFEAALPEPVRRLDRAAGLDHRELTARSLYIP